MEFLEEADGVLARRVKEDEVRLEHAALADGVRRRLEPPHDVKAGRVVDGFLELAAHDELALVQEHVVFHRTILLLPKTKNYLLNSFPSHDFLCSCAGTSPS